MKKLFLGILLFLIGVLALFTPEIKATDSQTIANGTYKIKSSLGNYLTILGGSTSSGANAIVSSALDVKYQQFKVTYLR